MEEKYMKAIKAGLVIAVIMIIAALITGPVIQYLVNTSDYAYYATHDIEYTGVKGFSSMPASVWIVLGLSALLGVFNLSMYFCSGLLAARNTRGLAPKVQDAAVVGAVAGVVTVVVFYPVSLVYSSILSLIFGGARAALATTIAGMIPSLLCCFPTTILIAVVIAIIGAVLYRAIRH